MFDRIDVNVINMAREIPLVADRMLPIAPLPDTTFASVGAALGYRFAGG
jgi:hypothetical protein